MTKVCPVIRVLAATVGLVLAVAACANDPLRRRDAAQSTAVPTPQPTQPMRPDATQTATPPATSAPHEPGPVRRLTVAHDGALVRMRVDESAVLVLGDPQAPEPAVEGDAVVLLEMVNVTASGARQWEVRAARPGRAVVQAVKPPDRTWTVTFVVSR